MFGLDVQGDYDAPGLAGSPPPADDAAPAVKATIAAVEEANAAWPDHAAKRVLHYRYDDGAPIMTVDHHPDLGYRLFALEQGVHFVSADGENIVSVPPEGGPSWLWQRYLVGQVLPLAAVLNGAEVLHASAVAVEDRAVGFVAASGVGKTSLALNLVLRGARFLTDDVAALFLRDGEPLIHPGPGMTNLRRAEQALMGDDRWARLGAVIGSDGGGLRLAFDRDPAPAPLRAIYLLERPARGTTAVLEELRDPDFKVLLGCRFTHYVNTPARLLQQLEMHAAIAARVRMFRISIPPDVDAAALSAVVESHVRDELA